ncbi:GNAT family N-acetyltransferase [Bacillus pseudomycoides]|uniref:GNAT family N-acetyltransferase n=1 Tax=Bacillus pseudomycoides TaxID=64104 RepID=A0AA91VC11_9BACI|nr:MULTISPECIES: GNAT family protein [Bacillus]PEB56503.1 GNAT family N-acetyltransferase [Bacillus sp. AFS098217]PED81500.1 GNAT family N-acetyltransferase [Bacillus pseudomycoides]PEU09391.1 GNAT family N-acetyltransferase [Bacillus sp. AFS019443]PEU12540.1 GNAT family N-acetyltransferase [Bacillus sp. AFS014408]PFW61819.1 GNAT family N-acetyltransferase [Bacillus sp. AFS075034]
MELFEYEERFEKQVESYVLTEEQLQFTGIPKKCVELSKADADRHSILFFVNNELVTFFVLHENEGVKPYSENPKAILLRAFSTDYYYQGKGYAKQSLLLLPEFVRKKYPHISEIVLAVNVNNITAQSLYKKCGFIDEGVRKIGKKGELIIMSLYLSSYL